MTDQQSSPRSFRITILLIVAFGGLTALTVGLVLFISAYTGLSGARVLMREQARLIVDSFEHSIHQHLAPAENMIRYIQTQVKSGQLDLDDREALQLTLSGTLAAAPQLSAIVVWRPDFQGLSASQDKDGHIVFSRIDNRNKAEFKAFFNLKKQQKGIFWGRPVRTGSATHLYAYSPLYHQNEFLGYVTTSISSVELSSFLDRLAIENGVTPFVIYGRNYILAHPFLLTSESRKLFAANTALLRLDQIKDPVLSGLPGARRRNPAGDKFEIHMVDAGGKFSLILSRVTDDFGTPPWRIGVHGPEKVWLAEMIKLRNSFAIGLVLLIVSVLTAAFLARRIASPIKSFASAATKIGHMDLGSIPPLRPSRIQELNDQSIAFNQMLSGLKQFETYLPKRLVNRLISEGGEQAAASRSAELSIMFTDIFSFTSMTEKLPAADTADMLNTHFEQINLSIEETGGTLDKYIGDSAMAFWGAPERQHDHARRAAITALKIAERISSSPSDSRWPDLRIKIALHSGPTIVGNIGARTRTNYTVIGDTVNTCSRIEGLSKQFDDGSRAIILISDETARQIGEGFEMSPVGEFKLRGRDTEIKLWRLTGLPPSL